MLFVRGLDTTLQRSNLESKCNTFLQDTDRRFSARFLVDFLRLGVGLLSGLFVFGGSEMGFYSARVEPKALDVHLEGRGCLGSSRMNILLRNGNFPGDGEDKLDSGKCVKNTKYVAKCIYGWLGTTKTWRVAARNPTSGTGLSG